MRPLRAVTLLFATLALPGCVIIVVDSDADAYHSIDDSLDALEHDGYPVFHLDD